MPCQCPVGARRGPVLGTDRAAWYYSGKASYGEVEGEFLINGTVDDLKNYAQVPIPLPSWYSQSVSRHPTSYIVPGTGTPYRPIPLATL
eukprot:3848615-Rhodomonas_salina.1